MNLSNNNTALKYYIHVRSCTATMLSPNHLYYSNFFCGTFILPPCAKVITRARLCSMEFMIEVITILHKYKSVSTCFYTSFM